MCALCFHYCQHESRQDPNSYDDPIICNIKSKYGDMISDRF